MTDPVRPVAPREDVLQEIEQRLSSLKFNRKMAEQMWGEKTGGHTYAVDERFLLSVRELLAAAPVPCAASPADLGKIRTEIGTVLRQVELTTHRADALPPATYSERPTIRDWRERVTWLVEVLNATWKALELEHLAQLRTAAKWSADKGQLLAVVERWNDRLEGWQNSDTEGYDALIAITCDIARESHHILHSDPLRATGEGEAHKDCPACHGTGECANAQFRCHCRWHRLGCALVAGTSDCDCRGPRATGAGARDEPPPALVEALKRIGLELFADGPTPQPDGTVDRFGCHWDLAPFTGCGAQGPTWIAALVEALACAGTLVAHLRSGEDGHQQTTETPQTAAGEGGDQAAPSTDCRAHGDRPSQAAAIAPRCNEASDAPPVAVALDPHRLTVELWALILPDGVNEIQATATESKRLLSDADCYQWVKWADVQPFLDELARLRGEAAVRQVVEPTQRDTGKPDAVASWFDSLKSAAVRVEE